MSVATSTVNRPPLKPSTAARLVLRPVRMERCRLDAGGRQFARQALGADLRAHEHQHRAGGPAQMIDQPVDLGRGRHGPRAMRNGFWRRAALSDLHVGGVAHDLSAKRTTSSGIVAEKSSVWRSVGTVVRMRRTSGQKPMSIIRSASSSTSNSTPVKPAFCCRR
jgi:hypothetical protein